MVAWGARDGPPRGEHFPKSDERGNPPARRGAPPSRHLWVGNLPHRVTEAALSEQFARFGEIESMAFVPGRSYAFVNFRHEEDALIAMKALQGADFAGFQLKIEFTKGEKPFSSSHGESHLQNRTGFSDSQRGQAFSQRDRRSHLGSPEKYYDRMRDPTNVEPSEVLWIGFPSSLTVDEILLGKAFSPFGEIDKITTFPGRTYAFVRFRSIIAASRAKEALHGKLFSNPRIKITFARSDQGSSEHGRSSNLVPYSSSFQRANDLAALDFSKRLVPKFDEYGDSGAFDINRGTSMHGRRGSISEWNERDYSEEFNESIISSPLNDRRGFRREFSKERSLQRPKVFDGHVSDDSFSYPDAKRMKIGSIPDKGLPENPYSHPEREKWHGGSRLFHERIESKPFNGGQGSVNPVLDEPWNDGFDVNLGSLPTKTAVGQKFTSETHASLPTELWKWEGTIAKGGTPICRARCFPVGKVLDVMLPEFLNCTARTTLDMLEKHFYQAANHWVVFFVPNSDSDIAYYDEFMHYLEEKQRAAVTKLSEKTTLFLVPPSDFSERVLKVPGKMSISGVVLKFQLSDSNFVPLHQPAVEAIDARSSNLVQKSRSPDRNASTWGRDYDISSLADMHSSAAAIPAMNRFYAENTSSPHHDGRISQLQQQKPALPIHFPFNETRNPSDITKFSTQASFPPNSFNESAGQENMSLKPRVISETVSTPYIPGTSGMTLFGAKFSQSEKISEMSSAHPVPSGQTDQHAQLAYLLEHQQQGKLNMLSARDDHGLSNLQSILDSTAKSGIRRTLNLPHLNAANSGTWALQHNQSHQIQPSQIEVQDGSSDQSKKQLQQSNDQVETEARLQATLQLAASLLQQIQQQGKT